MDQILQNIPGTCCILDGIIVTGRDINEHISNLSLLLKRLQHHGLRVNREKTEFLKSTTEFCGFKVDKDGIHKTEGEIRTMMDAPRPENTQQVRSFIGLVNYYARFIPNLSEVLHPLNQLLHNGHKWRQYEHCENSFLLVRKLITSAVVLTHYNPALPVVLACDASSYGVGAVMSHPFEDGSEHPIVLASKSLTTFQKNYFRIEKEVYAIVWAIEKSYCCLYGQHFTLVTDYHPLTSIFHPSRGISGMTVARLQRYAIMHCFLPAFIMMQGTSLVQAIVMLMVYPVFH